MSTRALLHARTPAPSLRRPDASLHALPAGVTTLMIGISTMGWMAGTGKGPDLFVAWHGGGVFMLRNEGQGRFTPHLTPTCRPDSFRPSRNAHNDEAVLWTPDCSDETGALNRIRESRPYLVRWVACRSRASRRTDDGAP